MLRSKVKWSVGILATVVMMLMFCFALFPAMQVRADDSFWNQPDIDPVSNPAENNWVSQYVANETNMKVENLTQEQFDAISVLRVPGDNNALHSAPKELGNLHNVELLNVEDLNWEMDWGDLADEVFQIPTIKRIELYVYEENISPRIFQAPNLEELYIGTISEDVKNIYLPDEIGDKTQLKYIKVNTSANNTRKAVFPNSIENLVNLEHLETDGVFVIPGDISNLKKLNFFKSPGTAAGTQIPQGIENCTELTHLYYTFSENDYFPDISKLIKLEYLRLANVTSNVKLPESIGGATNLQEIWLQGTTKIVDGKTLQVDGIISLPEDIGSCTQLNYLRVNSNKLSRLPDSITNLSKLDYFSLGGCSSLTALPEDFGNLTSLTTFNLSIESPDSGSLTYLPESFGNLTNLTTLNFTNQQLRGLPASIGNLQKIGSAYLEGNQIETLPIEIGDMSVLNTLELANNNLQEIPAGIFKTKVTNLDLSNNQITSVPAGISEFLATFPDKAANIDLSHNPLGSMPDLTLFAPNSVKQLNLDYCQIDDLGEWSPMWESFYDNQIGTLLNSNAVTLDGNHIRKLPNSLLGGLEDVKRNLTMADQTITINAEYDENTKRASVLSPLWIFNRVLGVDDKVTYTFPAGGGFAFDEQTMEFSNAEKGDVYQVRFDASKLNDNLYFRISNFKGIINVIVGDEAVTEHKVTVAVKDAENPSKDITGLIQSGQMEYTVLHGGNVLVKAPVVEGYELAAGMKNEVLLEKVQNDQTVTFEYVPIKKATVTIRLLEETIDEDDGQPVYRDISGEVPDYETVRTLVRGTYSIEAPTIANYQLETESPQEIVVNGDMEVTFLYKREMVTVTVNLVDVELEKNHPDYDLNDLAPDFVTTYQIRKNDENAKLRVTAPNLTDYTLAEDVLNNEYEFGPFDADTTVEIGYIRDKVTLTVNLVDVELPESHPDYNLNDLAPGFVTTYQVRKGDSKAIQVIVAPEITDYTLDQADQGNVFEFGPYTEDTTEVIGYIRDKVNVTVNLVDAELAENHPDYLLNGKVPTFESVRTIRKGDGLEIDAPQISGYTLIGDEIRPFGPFNEDAAVTITYEREKVALTVNLVDTELAAGDPQYNLNTLAPIDFKTTYMVRKGDQLEVEAPQLSGYELVGAKQRVFGPYNESIDEATEEIGYKRERATITVKLIAAGSDPEEDLSGLVPDFQTTYQIRKGEDFAVEAPTIAGYSLPDISHREIKAVSEDAVIIFEYTLMPVEPVKHHVTVKLQDTDGQSLEMFVPGFISSFTVEHDTEFTAIAPEIAGYVLLSESPRKINVDDDVVIIFEYAKEITITVKLVDENEGDLSYRVPEFETILTVKKGDTDYRIDAPVISGYTLESTSPYVIDKVETNTTVTFEYRPEELVESYTVTVNLEDLEAHDLKVLVPGFIAAYQVEKGSSFEITAPNIPNYVLKSDSLAKIDSVEADTTITFVYEENSNADKVTVSVKVIDTEGNDLSSMVSCFSASYYIFKGSNFYLRAPEIERYTLIEGSQRDYIFEDIQEDKEIVFVYEQKEFIISAKLQEAEGIDITGLAPNFQTQYYVPRDGEITITAPDIENYTLVSDREQTFSNVKADRNVVFEYKKNTATVRVRLVAGEKDITSLATDFITSYEVEIGESITVEAPQIPYYILQDDSQKTLDEITADEEIVFNYEGEKAIVDILLKDDEGNIITDQATDFEARREVQKGEDITVEAPSIPGYTLQGDPSKTLAGVTEDSIITFIYQSQKLVINVKLFDQSGTDISSLAPGFVTRYEVDRGQNFSVEAPEIPYYALQGDSIKTLTNVQNSQEIIFVYAGDMVTIQIKLLDVHGNDISPLIPCYPRIREVNKGTKNYQVNAPNITGYQIVGDSSKLFPVVLDNEIVTFTYEVIPIKYQVKVVVEDESGNDLSDLVENGQLEYEVLKGNNVTVKAPSVHGYTLVNSDQEYVELLNVNNNREVTFTYRPSETEKVGVTIQVRDLAENDLSSLVAPEVLSYQVTKGKPHMVSAPVIPGYIVSGESTQLFDPIEQDETVLFLYEPQNKNAAISVKLLDEQNNSLENLVSDFSLYYVVAAGSPFELSAPSIAGYAIMGNDYVSIPAVTENQEIVFFYKADVSPTNPKLKLTSGDAQVYVGQQVELKDFIVEASDSFHTDLRDAVLYSVSGGTLSGSIFTSDTPGSYTVEYTMTHPTGNLTQTKNIVVNAPISPVLKLTENKISLRVGESIDLFDYIAEAYAWEGGADARDQVSFVIGKQKAAANIFTPTEEGTYQIVFTLNNMTGGTISETLEVKVKKEANWGKPENPEKPEKPEKPAKPENPNKNPNANKSNGNKKVQTGKTAGVIRGAANTGDEDSIGVLVIATVLSPLAMFATGAQMLGMSFQTRLREVR